MLFTVLCLLRLRLRQKDMLDSLRRKVRFVFMASLQQERFSSRRYQCQSFSRTVLVASRRTRGSALLDPAHMLLPSLGTHKAQGLWIMSLSNFSRP